MNRTLENKIKIQYGFLILEPLPESDCGFGPEDSDALKNVTDPVNLHYFSVRQAASPSPTPNAATESAIVVTSARQRYGPHAIGRQKAISLGP